MGRGARNNFHVFSPWLQILLCTAVFMYTKLYKWEEISLTLSGHGILNFTDGKQGHTYDRGRPCSWYGAAGERGPVLDGHIYFVFRWQEPRRTPLADKRVGNWPTGLGKGVEGEKNSRPYCHGWPGLIFALSLTPQTQILFLMESILPVSLRLGSTGVWICGSCWKLPSQLPTNDILDVLDRSQVQRCYRPW